MIGLWRYAAHWLDNPYVKMAEGYGFSEQQVAQMAGPDWVAFKKDARDWLTALSCCFRELPHDEAPETWRERFYLRVKLFICLMLGWYVLHDQTDEESYSYLCMGHWNHSGPIGTLDGTDYEWTEVIVSEPGFRWWCEIRHNNAL